MEIVTSSELKTFRRCRRLHRNRYELRLKRIAKTELPLAFGTLFHRGLEAWWLAMMAAQARLADGGDVDATDALDAAIAAMTIADDDPEETELDEYEVARAVELMRGYHARWFHATIAMEILGVEVEFQGPVINPATGRPSKLYRLGGKIDALVRIDGRVWLVEHKTSSEDIGPGAPYWLRLRLDGQVSTYFEGGRLLGHDVGGCLYDVAGKPAQRPYKATPEDSRKMTKGTRCAPCAKRVGAIAEVADDGLPVPVAGFSDCAKCGGSGWKEPPRLVAGTRLEDETVEAFAERVRAAIMAEPDRWYVRGEVTRLDDNLREHGIDRWSDVRSMREAFLEGAHPTNPDACSQYGANRLCEFWGACTGTESLDDRTIYQLKPKKHSELSDAAEVRS